MNPMQLKTMLVEEAAYYDAPMNEVKIRAFAAELEGIGFEDLKAAVKFYRRQPGRRQMPSPADYIAAIPDGHLSANESWAMIPKTEDDSVVWSEEMRLAYGAAYPAILERNLTNAFFIYKETYEKLVAESKQKRQRPKWTLSEGDSRIGREKVIVEAVQKGRINLELACKIYPLLQHSTAYHQLAIGPGNKIEQIDHKQQARIAQLIQPKEIK